MASRKLPSPVRVDEAPNEADLVRTPNAARARVNPLECVWRLAGLQNFALPGREVIEMISEKTPGAVRDKGPAPPSAIDPICGMTVDPATAAGHADHEGKTY